MVRDTGIGISQENLMKLFAPFTQADGSTTRKYGGTGLGLAISRQIVDLMGGGIEVESEVGRGTAFSFTITFRKQRPGKEPPRKVSVDLRGLKTLVVDDNDTSREVLERIMASFGFRVTVAASGEKALELLTEAAARGEPFRLVLMDWRMPGMDGIEASKAIRKDPAQAGIKVVMITAFGRDREMKEGEEIGIDAFLCKPVQQSLLFNTLMEVFGQDLRDESGGRRHIVTEDTIKADHFAGARVLLVEDNAINQEVASKILSGAGLKVDVAGNGREAVEAVKKRSYDAVLMDIQMPEMDGYQATGVIREEARLNQLPIIAMTAHAMEGDREKCLEAGMNDYVSKPVNPEQLFSVLQKWIKPRVKGKAPSGAPVAPAVPAPAGPAADLRSLKGVDVEAGLRRLAGDAVLYRRLLVDFARSQAKAATEVRSALLAGDTERVRRLAHTLKGVAGNLAATGLEAAAREMESAARAGRLDGIGPKVEAMQSALTQVLESVCALEARLDGGAGAGQQAAVPADASELRPLLTEISARLAASDLEAEELVATATARFSSLGAAEDWERLKAQVAAFDFDGALATLRKIAAAHGISL
jgi:CheY-like chemotaxis protein/HPt (histidine-containing phosphotransfer) domain-containing protein